MSLIDNRPSRDDYKLLMEPTKPETLAQARRKLKNLLEDHRISQEDYDLFYEMLDPDGKGIDKRLDVAQGFND